jgi:hypothetical protein
MPVTDVTMTMVTMETVATWEAKLGDSQGLSSAAFRMHASCLGLRRGCSFSPVERWTGEAGGDVHASLASPGC